MIYRFLNYYNEFHCIADKCEATCCAGWQIVVDEMSLRKYKKVKKEFQERIKKGVDFKEGVFFQKEKKRCAFLNEHNLCDMYIALGEDSLCETCKRYPRHIEEFENVREFSLSVSCPVVAKMLLSKKEPVTFYEKEIEAEEEVFDDFNPMLYEKLIEARQLFIELLQDRKLKIEHRMALCWTFAVEFQDTMDEGILLTQESMKEHIYDAKWRSKVLSESNIFCYENVKQLFGLLWELEFLSDDWEDKLIEIEQLLYQKGAMEYDKIQKEFLSWQIQEIPEWDIIAEQLLVYFVFTYFCGSIYDEYVASKMKLAIVSVCYIREFMIAKWIKNNGVFSRQELVQIVYRYSRELEHSDENLCMMDKLLEEI